MKDAYPRNANLTCNEYWKAEMQEVDRNALRSNIKKGKKREAIK